MAAGILASPIAVGSASADTLDLGAGGLLSNIDSKNSSNHSNLCGTTRVGLLNERNCITKQHGHHKSGQDVTGPSGGLGSNIGSRNASGASNNCDTGLVGVLNRTTCVTEEK
ncbi:hypothetical protein [Streptomyces syringium]|uniref:hypothetical protein n=1 Tax=Streptomyces syringium TaxID=76729 RepID=UPI0033EA7AA0